MKVSLFSVIFATVYLLLILFFVASHATSLQKDANSPYNRLKRRIDNMKVAKQKGDYQAKVDRQNQKLQQHGILLDPSTHAYGFSHFNKNAAPYNCSHEGVLCMNAGVCDPMTGICECKYGFMGDDCSQKTCGHGYGPDAMNYCTCEEGWGGEDCIQCQSDLACASQVNSTNTTGICDQSLFTNSEKFFQCEITDDLITPLIGNITTMQCTNVSFDGYNGVCQFQSWAMDSKNKPLGYKAEVFWCSFYACKALLFAEDHNKISYECLRSECACTDISDRCDDPEIRFVIDHMKGKANVYCDMKSKDCKMTHENFPADIALICAGSECIQKYVPPPPPPPDTSVYYKLASVIVSILFIAIILVTLGVSMFYSHLHTRHATEEYHRTRHINMGASIEFKDLTYQLHVKDKDRHGWKTFLHGISYYIKPGSVVALMGPSGAGKTTLLDILANREKSGRVSGTILVNGKPIDKSYTRIAGYVFQEDVLMSTLTVRECLLFSANLRLPDCVPSSEKEQIVNKIMDELGITHIADRKIGDEMTRGISGGEKRRVSIGMELVIQPQLLFLDEPTSGLDAAAAYQVVNLLVNLAKKGRTILFSIHQPRSNIFQKFDEIVLLSGGNIAYAGAANQALEHFGKIGYQCPMNYNPADFLIDVLAQAQVEKKILNHSKDAQSYSPEKEEPNSYQQQEDNSLFYKHPEKEPAHDEYPPDMLPYATSFYSQFLTLSKRAFKNFYRNFYLMPAHYISATVMGALLGALYYGLGNDIAAVQNRIGSIFFMCCLLAFGAMSSLELFIAERAIYVREKANGYYYSLAYFLSKTVFDLLPLRVVPPIIMGSIAYFLIGLRGGADHFIWFILVMIMFNIVSGSLCIMIGSVAPSVASANVVATLLILVSSLFAGHLLNKDSIPIWLSWLKYLSIWNYAFEALLVNELFGFPVVVNPKGAKPFNADGSFWLNEMGMDKNRFSLDIIVLIIYAVSFIVFSGLLLKYFVREKR